MGDVRFVDCLRLNLGVVGDEGEGVSVVMDALDGAEAVCGHDGVDVAVDEDGDVLHTFEGNDVA